MIGGGVPDALIVGGHDQAPPGAGRPEPTWQEERARALTWLRSWTLPCDPSLLAVRLERGEHWRPVQ